MSLLIKLAQNQRYLIKHSFNFFSNCILFIKGARVDHSDKYGTTPLIWAARAGHTNIVEELLNAGAQV